ncbi:hypothetical protein LO762_29795 [Actinocorallia sp. API 0066]|uniref:hypothetical protein n=1 Tax=Actinocorallia sp. API 0066 TaxID=2896846 RepID=UPI001E28BDED|nr:hypothetical protein [Actinocorallia sp. API 0066]MCD0453342.1 hypothetical protein [Actinocorallia sp. API 0066]
MTHTTPPAPLDGAAFAAETERLTNEARLEEWLALYHSEAVADWIIDGAHRRYEGITEIRPAATAMASLWRARRLRVRKDLQCTGADTLVLTWTGGFGGRSGQFGTEIWTLRGGLVVRHQMYGYLDVRPYAAPRAKARVLLTAPATALALWWHEHRTARA